MDISILDVRTSDTLMLVWLGGTMAIALIAAMDILARALLAAIRAGHVIRRNRRRAQRDIARNARQSAVFSSFRSHKNGL